MKIENEKVVTLTYTLRENGAEGEIVEEVNQDRPFVFLFGSGLMLPKFEENLSGLEPGKKFEFLLKSNEAYGDYEEEAVIDVPKEVFMEDGKLREDLLQLGNTIPMEDTEGNQLNGVVAEIGDEKVKMDFNSPMAGRDLHFAGEVLDIRQATKEELEHGHVHGPEGHHH